MTPDDEPQSVEDQLHGKLADAHYELGMLYQGLSALLKTQSEQVQHLEERRLAQIEVVRAAQQFFGRDGKRWFDRSECDSLKGDVRARCSCGGQALGKALKRLDSILNSHQALTPKETP